MTTSLLALSTGKSTGSTNSTASICPDTRPCTCTARSGMMLKITRSSLGRPSIQYLAFLSSTMRLSRVNSFSTNGPVPTGLDAKSQFWSIRLLGMIAPQPEDRAARNGAEGWLSLNTTVASSGVSIDAIAAYSAAFGEADALSWIRSKVALTSFEVSTSPLWNITPLRSVKVQVRLSADTVQLSARGRHDLAWLIGLDQGVVDALQGLEGQRARGLVRVEGVGVARQGEAQGLRRRAPAGQHQQRPAGQRQPARVRLI